MAHRVGEIDLRNRDPDEVREAVLGAAARLAPGESLLLIAPQLPRLVLRALHEAQPGRAYVGLLEASAERVRVEVERRAPGGPAGTRDYLSWDHHRLERLLAEAAEEAAAASRARFDEFTCAFDRHVAVEEILLFPLLPQGDEGRALSREHAALGARRRRLLGALAGADPSRVAGEATALSRALRAHHAREERSLYEVADSALDEPERARLVAELQSL